VHASLCDHLLDLVQNALEAGAESIDVDVRADADAVEIFVRDDGCGMDAQTAERAVDPFFSDGRKHPHRRAGLGLPFLKQAAEAAGGSMSLESEPGAGTVVRAQWTAGHIDAPPVGDLVSAGLALLALPGRHELTFRRRAGDREWTVRRGELIDALGGLERSGDLALARSYLAGLEDDLQQRTNERTTS
jgi:hypothetical protein